MEKENKTKKINTTIIIVLIIIGLILLAATKYSIDKLTAAIINSNNNSTDDEYIDADYSNWDYRFDELELKIEQESSCLEDVKITLDEIDVKTGMGKIKIQVIPKEYTPNTKITVTMGEYCAELKQKKQKYVGEIETPFNEVYDLVYVSTETDEKIKNEKIVLSDNDEFCNWDEEIPSRVFGDADYDYDYNTSKCTIRVNNANFYAQKVEKESNSPILYITKNDNVVFQQEMQYDENSGGYQGKAAEDFDFKDGDIFLCYAEYTGKSGLKYRLNYFNIKCDDDEFGSEQEAEDVIVYDLNGKEIEFKYMDEDSEE